jgi:hypothetical protein
MNATIVRTQIRARAARRGAAMVEALIAIPVFIIIFTSMVYIVRLYGAKQRTLREAKQTAWTSAMRCGGGGGDPLASISSDGKDRAEPYKGAPGGPTLSTSAGVTSASSSATASESSALASFSHSVTTTTTVMCNEVGRDGDLQGVLGFAWDLWKNQVDWGWK